MDFTFYGGGFIIILWLLVLNIVEGHNNKNSKSNKCSDDPLPVRNPKRSKAHDDAFDD